MKRTILAFAMLVLASSAYADVPRPDGSPAGKKAKVIDTHLSIQLDKNAKQARLLIPRSQLKELRAQLDEIEESDDTAAAGSTTSFARVQTIVSGVFISLALVFGGIWFARGGKLSSKASKSAAAGMVIFAGGAFASIVYGNIGPPPDAREITGKMFSPAVHIYKGGGGKIRLEVSDTDTVPKLIVPDSAPTPTE